VFDRYLRRLRPGSRSLIRTAIPPAKSEVDRRLSFQAMASGSAFAVSSRLKKLIVADNEASNLDAAEGSSNRFGAALFEPGRLLIGTGDHDNLVRREIA
jgi:hypothetical protein